jgi:hypothetical protein
LAGVHADLYKNWKAWIRTKDLAREASPAIRSYLKAEFAKLRNSGILTISELKLGVLTTFLAQFGVMLRSVATSSCITNGFVRAGLCSRVARVAVAGPNIEKMLMTCARATDPSIYKAMYDGLPLIFPEINRCGGCDDEMLLNVGKFPQDVDSKGRLLPLRKCGPLRQRQSPSHQELEPQCSNGRPRAPDHEGRRGEAERSQRRPRKSGACTVDVYVRVYACWLIG